MKIATWNVNSIKVRLPQLVSWLKINQPEIMALQETKVIDEKFPYQQLQESGYEVIFSGQKAYNGVAILSKQKATDIITDIVTMVDIQRRILIATIGDIRICNLYVPNGESVGSAKYYYKLHWLRNLQQHLSQELIKYPKLIVLGDFNIAPEAKDVYDPEAWQNRVLFSEYERLAFKELLQLGLYDALRLFHNDAQFTWWDYRARAFYRNHGLRIDHILLSNAIAKCCTDCTIDKSLRGLPQPSDHAPVMTTFKVS